MAAGPAVPETENASSYGSFAFEVLLEAPAAEVWQALVRGERRSRWLRLPGRPGPQTAVDQPDLGRAIHLPHTGHPDDVAHLRGGTRLLLTALAVALGATPRPATER